MKHIEYWISDDGMEFDDEGDCIAYEIAKKYKDSLPFTCDYDFDGNFEKLYNNINCIEVINEDRFNEFAKDMYAIYGFYYPENVKTGEKYYYGDATWIKE